MPLQIPSGPTVSVKIIDTGARVAGGFSPSYLVKPPVEGFTAMPPIPAWSFLIENAAVGAKVLFDLSIPTDWADMAPRASKNIKSSEWTVTAPKSVHQVLREGGVDPAQVGSIIWSHWHWDHVGNPEVFPSTTELVVGPGFKKAFLPGYPANPSSPVRESDFKGRNLREIDFTGPKVRQLGQFRAYDFFGDGSFFLLDTPGHAIGHLGGLARTTSNPDTYILMGGDLAHHSGEIRPSKHLPLPKSVSPHPWLPTARSFCPGHALEDLQRKRNRAVNEPFFEPVITHRLDLALDTIRKTQEFDGDENVLFFSAHDDCPEGIVDLFPASANHWQRKGWREKMLWAFLKEFRTYLESHGAREQKL